MKNEEKVSYDKICDDSFTCTAERRTRVQGNIEFTYCQQCFERLGHKAVKQEKPEKASTEKPKEKPVKEMETQAVDQTVKAEKEDTVETYIEAEAKKVRETFADVAFTELDKIMAEINSMSAYADKATAAEPEKEAEVVTEVEQEAEFDPFAEDEPTVQEHEFTIVKCRQEGKATIRLVCEAKGTATRWLIDVETDPAKIEMINKRPELVTSKLAKVEYDSLDSEGRPINPKFLALTPKKQ